MTTSRTYTHESELTYTLVDEIPAPQTPLGAGRPPIWPGRFAFARSNPGKPVRIGPLSKRYTTWQVQQPLAKEPDSEHFAIERRPDVLPGEPGSSDPVEVTYFYVTYTPESV